MLLANREYDRLEASSVLVSFPGDFLETPSGFSEYPNRLTTADETFGFDTIVSQEKVNYFNAFNESLKKSGVGYVLSDTDLSPDHWSKYHALVSATEDWLDETTQKALADYAKAGGLLIIGPKVPGLGHTMEPCTVLADTLGVAPGRVTETVQVKVGEGAAIVVPTVEEAKTIGAKIAADVDVTKFTADDDRVDVVVHDDVTDSTHQIVFVCNPTDQPIKTHITVDQLLVSAHELWEDKDLTITDGGLDLELAPYTILIADCKVA